MTAGDTRDRLVRRLHAAVDRVPPWVQVVLAVAAYAAVATWLAITTWQQIKSTRLDRGPLTDFRDAVYYPLVALRDGVNPYDVDLYYRWYPVGQEFPLYTPIHLIAHSPLLAFSFPTARAVAFTWNLVLVPVYAAMVLRLVGIRLRVAAVFAAATVILLSEPGKFDLRVGQPTLMIVIAILAALRARGADPATAGDRPSPPIGAALGIAAVVVVWSKPTFAIPLVLILVVRSRVRIAVWGTVIAGALSAATLPWFLDAAGGLRPFIDSLSKSAEITSRSPQSKLGSGLRIEAANTLARITTWRPPEVVAALFGVMLLAAGAWLVWRLRRYDPAGDREELTITLICLILLMSVYHVGYDYLLLAGPLALLARRGPTTPIAWPRRVRTAVFVLLLVVFVDPLGWSPVNRVLGKSGFEWMLKPTMIGTYVLVALGLTMWTAVRQTRLPRGDQAAALSGSGAPSR